MRIGELARRAGVSVRSLRYYEQQGLVPADRTSGGHREYAESDVPRVRFVQLLFSAGLPSRTVVQILPFLDTGVATPRMRGHLDDEHARLQARIDELTAARDRLADLREIAAQAAAGRAPEQCALEARVAAG
ncbi:MerR family transcriptional regulator [Kineococcus rhizosphaerae]|uniref:DNA-binding transcriptional MerR regulator n=1 Tax=Kineococcus rhizosphaerae TaxID=559628 RepID=A0A2T0R3Q8_9ACTN|nr:MerR family transcriptional regulator [Kineococcus rhizosphaerae]PRY14699.1 DNA-binding transcriptional MerR regulator [Kineococcus rhizosphaerae]